MNAFFSARDRSLVGKSTVTLTPDDDFQKEWLTNGFPSYPVKKSGGALSASIAIAPAVTVGVVAVINPIVDEGNDITIGGDVSQVLTPPAPRRDGFAPSLFALITPPVPASALTIAVDGNSGPIKFDEFWAGEVVEFETDIYWDQEFNTAEPFEWESQLPPNDDGTERRRLKGFTRVSGVGLAALEGVYESSNRGSKPVLFSPDGIEPWMVTFRRTIHWIYRDPTNQFSAESQAEVHYEFLECERSRG